MFRIRKCLASLIRYVSTSKPTKAPIRPHHRIPQPKTELPQPSGIALAFGKYLLLTNTLMSGVLMMCGDMFQQENEYRQKKLSERYDYERLTRMFLVGVSLGPIHHYFYVWLARILPERSMNAITKKIMLDQFVMSPLCIVTFFYSIGILEMKTLDSSTEELKDKFVEVWMVDWCFWPLTQVINFYYIPVKYQVLYINCLEALYNVFLSYIKHRKPG